MATARPCDLREEVDDHDRGTQSLAPAMESRYPFRRGA